MVETGETDLRPPPAPGDAGAEQGAAGGPGGTGGPGGPGGPAHLRCRARNPLLGLGIFVLYLIPALVAFWHCLPHLATAEPEFGAGDLAKYNWCVAWVPYALGHGYNPLFTHLANVPNGVNLMDDTSVLGLGLLMSPVTVLFGPFATVNVLLILAYPLSAGAGYLLARRYVDWRPAAFAAGLLYGYSPYMIGQGYSHLNLSFVPIPALAFLLLDELLVRQRREPVRQGLLLGVLMAAQFMISTEIFATTVLFAAIAIAIVVLALWRRGEVAARLPHALRGLVPGAVLAVALLAWPAYMAVLGAGHIHGVIAGFRIYNSALLGPFLPTSLLVFGTHHMKVLGDRVASNPSENGSYLGAPLVVMFFVAVVVVRRRTVRVAGVLAIIAFVLSMGARLDMGTGRNAQTSGALVLPGALLGKVPLLDDSFPVRYSLYVALFVSVVLATALQALHHGSRGRPRIWLPALVAVAVFVPLVPQWPGPAESHVGIPSYFTTSAVDQLRQGEVALVYPMAAPANSNSMDWQVEAHFRFSMPGGYFVIPKPPSGSQFFLPTATARSLAALAAGQKVDRTPQLRARLTGELRSWGVGAVLVQPVGADPVGFFSWLIGRPPDARTGGMIEWYHTAWAARS